MKKIKIGFFNSFFPFINGGSEYQTYLLSQVLDREKFEYFFISLNIVHSGLYEINGIKVYCFKVNNSFGRFVDRRYMPNYGYLKEVLQKEKPDIVYQRMANSATWILQHLSKRIGFRFIWACASSADIETWQFTYKSVRDVPDYFLKKRGIAHADIILAQTNEQKDVIRKRFLREAILLRNGHPVPTNLPEKPKNKIVVTWIANFKISKQPELFINLAEQLQNLNRVQFIMIGRPSLKAWQRSLEMRIQKMGNIDYLGPMSQAEVNRYLEGTHLLVNTSKYEGFPNTFIQAWMRKVPVVSLNVDPDRLLTNGGLGFCSGNFEKMCQGVCCLIEDAELRWKIGENAHRYACQHHSIDKIGKQFLDIIHSLQV